ncbi:MAG TPA: hypothetical protein VIY49_09565 [Bryobacteraceae bacterium]
MLRYATREDQVDRLLRGHVLVDLHTITKQALRASVEQYSLKEIEKFCDYRRRVPLPDANQARHFIEHQLELSGLPVLTDSARGIVTAYNEDDCRATEKLRHWLETLRSRLIEAGTDVPRPVAPDATTSEALTAHQQRVASLFDALTRDLPAEPGERTADQAARWLLAHALDWHLREEKVKWWEFYRMKELSEEELVRRENCRRRPLAAPANAKNEPEGKTSHRSVSLSPAGMLYPARGHAVHPG